MDQEPETTGTGDLPAAEHCTVCGAITQTCTCDNGNLLDFLKAFRAPTGPPVADPAGTADIESQGLTEMPPELVPPGPNDQPFRLERPEWQQGQETSFRPSRPASDHVDPPSPAWPWLAPPAPPPYGGTSERGRWAQNQLPALQGETRPTVSPSRRRRSAVLVIAIVAMTGLISAAVAIFVVRSGPTLSGLDGAQIMRKSLDAASKAGSAHAVAEVTNGGETVTATIDFSSSGGIEATSYGNQTMTILYVDGSLYMRASSGLLAQMLHVSADRVSQYGGRWIVLPTDNQDLQQLAGQLQTPIIVSDLLTLSGPIATSGIHHSGQIAVQGRLANNPYNAGSGAGDLTTLVVSTRAPFYPASLSYSDVQNGSTMVTFSHWGEHVNLRPPSGAVPVSVLGGDNTASAPSGPDESTTPAPVINATSEQAGIAVTANEGRQVAAELWQAWVKARATRDATALRTLDAQPELAADWGYICQYGCRGPQLALSSIEVRVH
jgi:hypothetical protein